jgi:isochorismate synthase
MREYSLATRTDPISAFCAAAVEEPRALWLKPATGESLVTVGNAAPTLCGMPFDPSAEPTALWSGFRDGPDARPQSRLGLEPEQWKSLVADVASTIRTETSGLRKVVLARAAQMETHATLGAALRYLATNYATCTVFAYAQGEACFIGATPERLVSVRGGIATTMALAGSAPRGATPEMDEAIGKRLLSDPKERTEHAVVVEALRQALESISVRVVAAAEPELRKLPNVQHLCTPIRAQLLAGHDVLAVVHKLHPTPAVGGYPREPAMALIREREMLDRGWYAAPFGWVDGQGNGEFVVALRSALVRDKVATLFAGCGIVGESQPDGEFAEWGWKLRPMLSAFNCRL